MAEYLTWGATLMGGVGTSTAGFIGLAEKGPTAGTPVLITSFAEYQRRFGSYLSPQRYGSNRFLPNAVEHFFTNGGNTCYVMRVVPEDSTRATVTQGRFTFTAKDPGEWGNQLSIVITADSKSKSQVQSVAGKADDACTAELPVLNVVVSHGSMTETYSGCTLNPDSSDYLITRLQLSQLVTVTAEPADQSQKDSQSAPPGQSGRNGQQSDPPTVRRH